MSAQGLMGKNSRNALGLKAYFVRNNGGDSERMLHEGRTVVAQIFRKSG